MPESTENDWLYWAQRPGGYWEKPGYAEKRERLAVLMGGPRIHADVEKWVDADHLALTAPGTWWDLRHYDLEVQDGMFVNFFEDDGEDEEGNPDPMLFEGPVHFDTARNKWLARIDSDNIRHLSHDRNKAVHGSSG